MAKWAIIFGLALCGLGVAGWMGGSPTPAGADNAADAANNTAAPAANTPANSTPANTTPAAGSSEEKKSGSVTALIPAFVGLPLLLCGLVGLQENLRKHAMHLAAGVALLGFLGAGGRLASKAGAWISGDPSVNSRAMWFIVAMTVICFVYVVLSVKSFVDARKARAMA